MTSRDAVYRSGLLMAPRMRLGVIGAGEIVRSHHLPVLRSLPDVAIAWLCDADVARARAVGRTFGIERVGPDLDQCPDPVDVILIATPVGVRRPLWEAVFERRSHVLCEKPFARSAVEHRWILARARTTGVRVRAGLVRRELGSTDLARRSITGGLLGAVHAVIAGEGSRVQRTGREQSWYQASASEAGGGVLMETGPHLVDQVMKICDARAATVQRCEQVSVDSLDLHTTARGTVEIASGEPAPFRIDVSRLRDVWNGILIRCERGELRVGLGPDGPVEVWKRDGSARARLEVDGPRDVYAAFAAQWRSFLSRCRGDDDRDNDDTGLLTTEVIEACYRIGAGKAP